ncbi:MAG: inositol monophosphatase family protein [Polyangiales bacterium]
MTERLDEPALLAVALDAARLGAEVLAAHWAHATGVRPAVERKGSAIDLVTAVDRESERVVVGALRETGLPIVAEEGSRVDGSEGRGRGSTACWYVDPLDGTTNFAMGHPFHCVSIGLLVDGAPRLGVGWAPQLHAVRSRPAAAGARRDLASGPARPLAVSPLAALDAVLVGTGFPYDRRTSDDDNLAAHNALMKRTQGVMRCGSAAIDLCMVADGTYGAIWERKLKPWDLVAGAALVLGAGGRVGDPWGRPFVATEGAVLASNGRLHEAMLAALAPHLPTALAR